MIAKLSILVDALTGPAGKIIASKGPSPGTVILKPRKPPRPIHNMSPSVRAFQLADRIYKSFGPCKRHLWNAAQRQPCKSGYDLWMQHAGANIAAGYLPPTIPPTAGGFRRGLVPPGPVWYEARAGTFNSNQTCYGPIAWTWSRGYCLDIAIDINLDLRHPDDDKTFNVALSTWLLWNDNTSSWMHTSVNQVVRNNYGTRITIHDVDPSHTFSNVGVIEVAYANLHQRFVILAAQIIRVPLDLCKSPAFSMAETAHSETPFLPGMTHFWRPPDCHARMLLVSGDDSYPRVGTRRQLRAMTSIIDLHGGNAQLANVHVVGLKFPHMDRPIFDWHCWQYQYMDRFYYVAPPYNYSKTGRTILHLDGTAFSFPWIENETHKFDMVLPPATPEKP